MKALLQKYRSVIRFVVLFLGTYLVLTLIYSLYLSLSKGGAYPPDFITNLVAKQSSSLLNGFGVAANVVPHETQPTMKLFVEGQYLARIIEGCNAVSIIILFISFIISFAEKWKKTLLFIFAGAALIYGVNIIRISVLSVALYHYPEQESLLHGIVFPGIIYGMVFLLWMFWVRSLSIKAKEQNE
ncbi:MAG: exosortase family protein XrtF [Flavobacteriaceae bacterium]|nr:exosortase family protein XrtF [Flavobacteriaceae bacterium]